MREWWVRLSSWRSSCRNLFLQQKREQGVGNEFLLVLAGLAPPSVLVSAGLRCARAASVLLGYAVCLEMEAWVCFG